MKRAGVLIGVILLSATPASAQIGCQPYSTSIRLSFKTLDPDPTYNNGLNVTSLRDFLRTRGHIFSGRHQRMLGVTSFQAAFSLTGSTYAIPTDGGGFCVYLREVTAEFGYREHDVFVASEFAPGSCEHNAILDHENQHVAINRAAVRQGGPRIRQELERLLQAAQPRFTRDLEAGTDLTLTSLSTAINSTYNQLAQEQASRNAVIDSENNYDAIGDLCKNWEQGNVWPTAPTPAPRRGSGPK